MRPPPPPRRSIALCVQPASSPMHTTILPAGAGGRGGGEKARGGSDQRETTTSPTTAPAAVRCVREGRLRRRRQQAWSARLPFLLVVAALASWVGGSSGAGCQYERITEQGDGSFQVPVDVRHTFDVPPADSACPQGERERAAVLRERERERPCWCSHWLLPYQAARRHLFSRDRPASCTRPGACLRVILDWTLSQHFLSVDRPNQQATAHMPG